MSWVDIEMNWVDVEMSWVDVEMNWVEVDGAGRSWMEAGARFSNIP